MANKFYFHQSASWLRSVAALWAMGLCAVASAQTAPQKPVNFKAETEYSKVVLTWDDPTPTQVLLSEDFEGSTFPSDGWSVKTTNTDDYLNTWFQYPSAEMEESGVDDESRAMYVHGGKKSALVYFDMNAPHEDGSSAAQNEWLYLPKTPGAEYLSFYSYINPSLLEYGTDEDFPDHYYVKVSHDDGATWQVVWDARTDMANIDAFQNVRVYLGDASKGDPIVAFQAVGDVDNPETGLYFAWAIDDVQLLKSTGDKNSTPIEAYNLYYDDEVLAENLYSTSFTDLADKEPGRHVYALEAVSNSTNTTSERIEINVDINAPKCNAPTNVQLSSTDDGSGKYSILVKWSEPEGDRKPSGYSVYCNNALVAGYLEDLEVEQTGKPKGVYTYQVVANYENPDGDSEPTEAEATIAVGTRPTATGLTAERNDDSSLSLTWNAPAASEYTVDHYAVYRGNTKLGDTKALSFIESEALEGVFSYAVKAVYTDSVAALPATTIVTCGDVPTYQLPFSEDFTGGLTPENWTIEKIDGKLQDQYMWRFDNWFDTPVTGGGFSGDFASISSSVAGYTLVWSVLVTPPLVRGALAPGESTFLEFDLDYNASGKSSIANVNYSYNGEDWAVIGGENFTGYLSTQLSDGQTCMPEHKVYDITDCFVDDTTPIYIAWNYKGKIATHMAIDNVRIYNAKSSGISAAKGDVAYTVANGSLRVNGSSVSRVQVYSADGVCHADVSTSGSKLVSLPLADGVNVVKFTTADGVKTVKVNK